MANNMICPGCGKAGFIAKFLLAESRTIKCSECGAWSEPVRWELTKTGAQHRAELTTLRADLAAALERIEEQERNEEATRKYWSNAYYAMEAERDELKADAVRFKIHLEQKGRALAANAEEYKKLQAEFFDYTHETSKLRDQLNEAQSDLKDALRIIYEDAKYKKGFEDCRDAVIKTTKGRISAVLAQELGALTVTERGKDEKA
ncbi:MAG: hypothetical protein A2Y38_25255 [Spirochaetes bacterium GWB1_59_5]|nr:MAG: hypothetical protein A2Y38_25255 [Spirochaetes bacterium GWB1_59_5]